MKHWVEITSFHKSQILKHKWVHFDAEAISHGLISSLEYLSDLQLLTQRCEVLTACFSLYTSNSHRRKSACSMLYTISYSTMKYLNFSLGVNYYGAPIMCCLNGLSPKHLFNSQKISHSILLIKPISVLRVFGSWQKGIHSAFPRWLRHSLGQWGPSCMVGASAWALRN